MAIREAQSAEILIGTAIGTAALYECWDTLSFESNRQIGETIVRRITVEKEEIAIDLDYLPTAHPS